MQNALALNQALLNWFADFARPLPWRSIRDPYAIMVSEVMLQQTQVDRVIPKWHAFLTLFPTVEALAQAPTADVIRAWSGMGYNRRAIYLQRTAQAVVEQGGLFPQSVKELRTLPGIGDYTAGAIACFAFEQDVVFLDTNIRRVLRRLTHPPTAQPTDATLLETAKRLLPSGQGWHWNQAIMELGALVCVASTPACWKCPLRNECADYAARQHADQTLFDAIPTPPPRKIAERKSEPFIGSTRYYRGRIIEVLRQQPADTMISYVSLGQAVRSDFDASLEAWLAQLLERLARDGLVVLNGQEVRLP